MFFLNGKQCIEPAILKLTLGEAGSFCWWDKYSANHFRHQCGVDPGEGYLLLNGADIPYNTYSVPLVIGNITIPKVVVVRSIEVTPKEEVASNNTTKLVKVADIRCYLKKTLVKKDYNVIKYFDSSGSAIFDQTTMKHEGGSSYVNWTWETLINDLWDSSLLSSETLNLDDAEFPEELPNNYYFDDWTHRDALGQVLLDLGFTLEPNTDGSWRVAPVNSDSTLWFLLNGNAHRIIDANNFTPGPGAKIPAKLIFHFLYPEESPGNKENRTYTYEHTVAPGHGYQVVLSGSSYPIICPIAAEYDFTDPTNPVNKMDLDLWASTVANRLIKLLFTEDGPDVTLGGIVTAFFPSADMGRVTWKNTGSNVTGDGTGAITRVEHFFPLPTLPKLERPTVPLQKVAGYPVSNVTPENSTFQIQSLELISGVRPQEPLTVNNTYGRSFSTTTRVEAEYCYETREWNTPESGSGTPTPSQALIRFELIEDKSVDSFAVDAFHINPNNAAVLSEIVVVDPVDQRFMGYGLRIDPQFGSQVGFRGWAQFAYSTTSEPENEEEEPVTTNFYHIIAMEGPARWIEGETFQEIEEGDEDFIAEVFDYWGASPNNRAPATFFTEGTSDQGEVPVVRIYDEYRLIKKLYPTGTKYRAIFDEYRNIYILVSLVDDKPYIDRYGLLVVDVPACSWTLSECTHGFAGQAVIVFSKQRTDPDDEESPHKLKSDGRYDVINPIYPTVIKAGETTDADKPVVAIGYLDDWVLGDGQTSEVFVLKNVIYPITLIKGTSSGTVSGTGNITVDVSETLWGRPPEEDQISVANPEGWDGPNASTVIAMQKVDGTWLALYVQCPS